VTHAHKVIFDTDPGADDAMALYFALAHPDIELLGITSVFGNVTAHQAMENALYLTRIAGFDIPVALGASKPLSKLPGAPPAFIHGADGLGNLETRVAINAGPHAHSAAEFIVNMARAHPGEITLVAVAPQTNLALALKIEPELPKLLKEVVMMAGAIVEPGNVSPVAEANVWNDPDAADIVFTAGWPLTMVGLDATHKVVASFDYFDALAKQHKHLATDTLRHAMQFYCSFYQSIRPELGHACFCHDVLAFVYLVAPELFTTQEGRVRVAIQGIENGQTMMDRHNGKLSYPQSGWEADKPVTKVCMNVNASACLQLIEKTLNSALPCLFFKRP
jgi:inosine-uridine nucleoside N-ribohydrolase